MFNIAAHSWQPPDACISSSSRHPPHSPSPAVLPITRSITGLYYVVTCIHYPQDKADAMMSHLAPLSDCRRVLSFPPKTPDCSVLKRIGELFQTHQRKVRTGGRVAGMLAICAELQRAADTDFLHFYFAGAQVALPGMRL